MSPMYLYIFSYFALLVFGIGLVIRAVRLAGMPVHLRWELTPVPHEKGKGKYGGSYLEEFEWWTQKREKSLIAEAWYMFLEIFLLKGVWENNRRLWIFSMPFHQGLYFGILMSLAFVTAALVSMFGPEDISQSVAKIGTILAWIAYALGAVGAIGLFVSRMADSRLRKYTAFGSYFNLALLAAMFVSGLYALTTLENFSLQMRSFFSGMCKANFILLDPVLTVHLTIAFLFVLYLPFTYMMHFVAKYFTYHQIRWDDKPLNEKMEKRVGKLLEQPVTWSASHINADGKKNWVDIATEEAGK